MHQEDNFKEIEQEYNSVVDQLYSIDISQDCDRYITLTRRLNELEPIMQKITAYNKTKEKLVEVKQMYDMEPSLAELCESELEQLTEQLHAYQKDIEKLLSNRGKDEKTLKRMIMELRAGTGGEEAALFVSDVFRMYTKYFQKKGYDYEILSSSPTSLNGFKEIIFSVEGEDILKLESGVHRVQRIPITEASGRIHTSTITVAVLEEPKNITVKLDPNELKIETFRAGGPGGQHVNVTDSAVRIIHLPTGIVVSCQDERSQIKNRQKALRILQARVLHHYKKIEEDRYAAERKQQIKDAERSQKIRTYNFPQNRLTDHRLNKSFYNLQDIMEGNLDELLEELRIWVSG